MEPIHQSSCLEHLREQILRARSGSDPESVHQVRVAAGRLSVWIELSGLRILRDDLTWLRHGAGRLREVQVLMDSKPAVEWLAWLDERRARLRREFLRLLDDQRIAGLLAALSLLPPLVPARGAEQLEKLLARTARRGARVEAEPSDLPAFHRLRKSLRRVRFAREWLGEDARSLKSLQASLGALHDACVALDLFDAWPGREALSEHRRTLVAEVEELRRKSLARWKKSALREEVHE